MSLKRRGARNLVRKIKQRESYDSVLIVCEGIKTEPYYFEEVRKYFHLSQANVVIDPNSESSPISVVDYSIKLINQAIRDKNPYTKVYCVIDRDRHPSFSQAISKITGFNSTYTSLNSGISIPCFEYWILMHFESTTSPFGASGASPCEDLIKTKLRKHIPGYSKADRGIYKELVQSRLDIAITNSKITLKAAKANVTDDPSTTVHVLIEDLKNLKD